MDVSVALAQQSLFMRGGALVGFTNQARWLYLIGRLAPGVYRHAGAPPRRYWVWCSASCRAPIKTAGLYRSGWCVVSGAREVQRASRWVLDATWRADGPWSAWCSSSRVRECSAAAFCTDGGRGARRGGMELASRWVRAAVAAARAAARRSLLLSGVGGAIGVGVAFVAGDLLVRIMSRGANPIELALDPNVRTLMFTVLVSAASGLVFGIAPSLRAARHGVIAATRARSGAAEGRTYWSQATIAIQVALCLVLLVEAGVFVRTLTSLRAVNTASPDSGTLLLVNVRPAARSGHPP